MSFKSIISALCVVALTTTLGGCGFKMRGSDFIPPALKVMQLDSEDKYSELATVLKGQLQLNDIRLLEKGQGGASANQKAAHLKLFKDRLDRRTLSIFPNGQVAEYELIYSVRYAVTLPEQEPRLFDFEIYRDYQDDPQSALAKSKELKLVLKEMRRQAADKIIRQLASFNSGSSQG